MDPLRELPGRPAVHGRARGRTDGSIRLRVTALLTFSLALKGAFSNRGLRVNGFLLLRTAGLTPRGHGSLRGRRLGRRIIGSGGAPSSKVHNALLRRCRTAQGPLAD